VDCAHFIQAMLTGAVEVAWCIGCDMGVTGPPMQCITLSSPQELRINYQTTMSLPGLVLTTTSSVHQALSQQSVLHPLRQDTQCTIMEPLTQSNTIISRPCSTITITRIPCHITPPHPTAMLSSSNSSARAPQSAQRTRKSSLRIGSNSSSNAKCVSFPSHSVSSRANTAFFFR
jgi:hypothetical protein